MKIKVYVNPCMTLDEWHTFIITLEAKYGSSVTMEAVSDDPFCGVALNVDTDAVTASIKDQISGLQEQAKVIQDQIEALQATCKHEAGFTEGLSMVACVMPALFCNECGYMKPIDYNGEQFQEVISGC